MWRGADVDEMGLVLLGLPRLFPRCFLRRSPTLHPACFAAQFPHHDHLQPLCTSAHHPPCSREPPKEPRRHVTAETRPIGSPDRRTPQLTALYRRSCGAHRDALPARRWPREVCSATPCSPNSAAHLEMLTGLQPSLRSTRISSSPLSSAASTRLP